MKRGCYVLSIVVLCLLIPPTSRAETIHSDSLPPDKAKVIITFEEEISLERVEQLGYGLQLGYGVEPSTYDIVEQHGGQVLRTIKIIHGVVAIVNRDVIEQLKRVKGVRDVAIDAKIEAMPCKKRNLNSHYRNRLLKALRKYYREARSEEELNQLMLQEVGITVGWNLQEPGIAAADTPPDGSPPDYLGAWSTYSVDGSGVIIAILDTGVNYNLEDLNAPNYLGGYDFYNNDADPIDDNWDPEHYQYGHGTLVTTIAVAQGEEKIKGAAPSASYYALKVLGSNGTGEVSIAITALDWCVNTANPKPNIVNMSFGRHNLSDSTRALFEAACNAAYNAGIALVACSGNEVVEYSAYPARFDNVISVGGHAEDQTLYVDSNGGVDVIAPGRRVPSMDMKGDASWLYNGTSNAAPHVAGLLALQLQYARENNKEINNGYKWELIKHSAIDLGLDPIYQGKGKARAKESLDLMTTSIWPFDYNFDYIGPAFYTPEGYPAYYLGTTMTQDITLTNITAGLGNTDEIIENLNVTTIQKYRDTGDLLPGDSTEEFTSYEPITLDPIAPTDIITLLVYYDLPLSARPGLYNVVLDLEFTFDGNGRVMRICDNEASIWCPPGPPPEDFMQALYGEE